MTKDDIKTYTERIDAIRVEILTNGIVDAILSAQAQGYDDSPSLYRLTMADVESILSDMSQCGLHTDWTVEQETDAMRQAMHLV